MPSYAKFLKELLSNKKSLGEIETVAMTRVCGGGMQNKPLQKLQDPGSFSIPCSIGNHEIGKALCDLGASVSLIPLSICEKLNMGDPKPTNMTLQMADRSIKQPVGIIEDVPLKVGKFFIPIDFVVLDMEEDRHTPIILGRPFLATAGAIINMKAGKLTFSIGDETVDFNILATSHFASTAHSCCKLDFVDRFEETEPIKSTHDEKSPQIENWNDESSLANQDELGKPISSYTTLLWSFLDKSRFRGTEANQSHTQQSLGREMDLRTLQPP